ncbi:hypothetical protein [Aquibium oceanicum]
MNVFRSVIGLSAAVFLAGCVSEGGSQNAPATSVAASSAFRITGVSVPSLKKENLCASLGGGGATPSVVVRHSAVAGVPIRVRMYDVLSTGRVFEHGTTRVMSNASGTTTVTHRFRPPCNTSGGRRNSSYRFDVTASGQTVTERWGTYNSGTGKIN